MSPLASLCSRRCRHARFVFLTGSRLGEVVFCRDWEESRVELSKIASRENRDRYFRRSLQLSPINSVNTLLAGVVELQHLIRKTAASPI